MRESNNGGGLNWESDLYDTVAGIGGLINLLVPEPNLSAEKFNPENIHQSGLRRSSLRRFMMWAPHRRSQKAVLQSN
jgi:hypothetical protein